MGRPRRDRLAFFRQVREHYHTTGAIAPSSRFLARAQTGPLVSLKSRSQHPIRVLEVGPGTGAVTRRIVDLLEPDDRFDLVEINQAFADVLESRFLDDPPFARMTDSSRIHTIPLQDYTAEEPYDIIISGLPMNNFSQELVAELFEAYFRLLNPEGTLSYFEYMFMRPLRKAVSGRNDRERVNQIATIMRDHRRQRRSRTSWVFANLPPAWVQHLSGASDDPIRSPDPSETRP
ncbi:MAG: methyltransferase domain-containing protein [Planctomycetaceae bacterium]